MLFYFTNEISIRFPSVGYADDKGQRCFVFHNRFACVVLIVTFVTILVKHTHFRVENRTIQREKENLDNNLFSPPSTQRTKVLLYYCYYYYFFTILRKRNIHRDDGQFIDSCFVFTF